MGLPKASTAQHRLMFAPQPQIRFNHARVIRQFVSGTYLAGASGGTSASMEGSSFIAGLSAAPIRVRRYCR